ncbi:MAG: TOBE domain-containing protein [Luteimonas sp.]
MPRRPPPTIRSALSVATSRGAFTGKRWMPLLAALTDTASITAAAKAVGLSYKAAWDAIEAMNNLSDAPLVERSVGGKGGGSTRLTARGIQLVTTWQAAEADNARFVQRINARIATAGPDLALLGKLAMLTSARNQFAGTVLGIVSGAVNDEVELQLSGGDRIVATLTRHSVEHLGLAVGAEAVALVKASSVIVASGDTGAMRLSARNQLVGTLSHVLPGAVNTEVTIALAGSNSVVAIITNVSAQAMALAEGGAATAVFKASSVMLAVAGC